MKMMMTTLSSAVAAGVGAANVNSSLPRIGLGMAALGRPGYINLDRGVIFDDNDNACSATTTSTGAAGADATTGAATATATVARSIEKMQSQSDLVLDALFAQAAEELSPPSSTTSTTTTTTTASAPVTATSISTMMRRRPWIDCARSYGLSEKFVGEYLRSRNIAPKDVYVSSKWGYSKLKFMLYCAVCYQMMMLCHEWIFKNRLDLFGLLLQLGHLQTNMIILVSSLSAFSIYFRVVLQTNPNQRQQQQQRTLPIGRSNWNQDNHTKSRTILLRTF
jgi:hypothetical protein